jgi:peptidyl-prolyl cis-trans isomerase SurA
MVSRWLEIGENAASTAKIPPSFFSFLATFFLISTSVFANNEILIDRVAAVVNGHPILSSEIKKKLDIGPLVAVSDYPAERDSTPRQRALNDAINLQLILQSAKDLDIDVTDSEVDREIDQFLTEQKMTKQRLIEVLKNEGQSFDNYRQDYKTQLILRSFQRRAIVSQIKITDRDLETYYLTTAGGDSSSMIEVTLRQLVFKIDADVPKEVQEAKVRLAAEVQQKIRNGFSFAEAVRLHSDEPSARDSGGLMSGLHLKDLATSIRSSIETLKVNEISEPVRIANSIFIFQLVERKLGSNKDFEAKKQQLERELRLIELRNQTNHWLTENRQKAAIQILEE